MLSTWAVKSVAEHPFVTLGLFLAIVVVVTAPLWTTMLDSLLGRDGDYEARIDARKHTETNDDGWPSEDYP